MDYRSKLETRRMAWISFNVLGCILVVVNMATAAPGDQCEGGYHEEARGEITSPNYPGRFPTRTVCLWRIRRPVSGPMTIKFPEFNIEGPLYDSKCDRGFVKVYDGDTTDSEAIIAFYCGTTAPPVHSTSDTVVIVLYATEWQPGYRFRLTYGDSETCESKGGACRLDAPCLYPSNAYCRNDATCCMRVATCGGIYHDRAGEISSPGFPGNYDVNQDCVYTIIIRDRHRVALKFKEFELEGGAGCPRDYLVAYDGPDVNSPVIGSRMCGRDWKNLVSPSGSLTLLFHSDSRSISKGFHALWMGTENLAAGCSFWDTECRIGLCKRQPDARCPDKKRCCQEACDFAVNRLCPDGSCVSNNVSCPTTFPPLPEGGVHCPVRYNVSHCEDGSCISADIDCGCTRSQPHSCDEGELCYDESKRCDGSGDCMDGSDEDDCKEQLKAILGLCLIIAGIILPIACCCYCCCCRKKKKKQVPTSAAVNAPGNTTENTALTAAEPQPQPQPSAPDQPQPYPPGLPQPYPPYPPMGPPMGAMPNYGPYPPMGAAPTAPPPPGFTDAPPPYEAVAWAQQPQDQPVEILKPPLEENC